MQALWGWYVRLGLYPQVKSDRQPRLGQPPKRETRHAVSGRSILRRRRSSVTSTEYSTRGFETLVTRPAELVLRIIFADLETC